MRDARAAAKCFFESLALFRPQEIAEGVACCQVGVGGAATLAGQSERAARLLGAAEALLGGAGARMDRVDQAEFQRIATAARTKLDDQAWAAAWAAGQAMPLEDAIA